MDVSESCVCERCGVSLAHRGLLDMMSRFEGDGELVGMLGMMGELSGSTGVSLRSVRPPLRRVVFSLWSLAWCLSEP